jgi:hypothetical protein
VMQPAAGQMPVGELIITGEGEDVSAQVIVTDNANNAGTFTVPGRVAGMPALRLDRTPPEAFNRFDPAAVGSTCTTVIGGQPVNYACTNKVYGTDNLPGLRTSAFAPVEVSPTQWSSTDDISQDWNGASAEYHVYSFDDTYTPSSGPGRKSARPRTRCASGSLAISISRGRWCSR